jgi:adenylate kinase
MNILIFGPNGSGKGTQGAIVQKKYKITHVESGVIFRQNIKNKTPLGMKAKEYMTAAAWFPTTSPYR